MGTFLNDWSKGALLMHLALGDVPFVPAVWDTPCFKRLACVNLFSLQ